MVCLDDVPADADQLIFNELLYRPLARLALTNASWARRVLPMVGVPSQAIRQAKASILEAASFDDLDRIVRAVERHPHVVVHSFDIDDFRQYSRARYALLEAIPFTPVRRVGTTVNVLNLGVLKPRGSTVPCITAFTRDNPTITAIVTQWATASLDPQVDFSCIYITRNFPTGKEARHRDVRNHDALQGWRCLGAAEGGNSYTGPTT